MAVVLLLLLSVMAFVFIKRPDPTLDLVRRLLTRLSVGRAAALENAVSGLAEQLEPLARDQVLLLRTIGWPAANWLLDVACLRCCLRAYGFTAPLGPLLAVYGAVNLIAMLTITPGRLGIVEGVLVPVMVSFGAPSAIAMLGGLTTRRHRRRMARVVSANGLRPTGIAAP